MPVAAPRFLGGAGSFDRAGAGGALGALALLCGGAALTERPTGHVRKIAWAGVTTGAFAVAALLVWIGLAALGV